MTEDMLFLAITGLARKLEMRELTPVDVVDHCLSRIDQINRKLNAFVTITADAAREAARIAEREIQQGKYRGPLHGVPVGIKDIVDTAGVRTTYGSAIFKDNLPSRDATVVTRLKEAGAIILGKTNTHEFALGVTTNNLHYGATRNPWSLDRIPGGSSGGSAAAVAAGMCYGTVGTDTGGSIRIPAAFCGLVGLKPTYGRVSTTGVFPLAAGMDHVGPMTRAVADAALMLQAMAGFDKDDPRSLLIPTSDFSKDIRACVVSTTTIAISQDLIPDIMDSEIRIAYERAIGEIENLGGKILEVDLKSSDLVEDVSSTLLLAEAAAQHSLLLEKYSDKYGSNVIPRFRKGQEITTAKYIEALRASEVIRREVEVLFKRADFLLTPSVQSLPPKIGEEKATVGSNELDIVSCCVRFTRLANITGIPAIAMPYGYSADGLPLSIQLMAPKQCEGKLLNFAYALEAATPELRNRRPNIGSR